MKAPYKQPQTSAFHLACVWKSGFLPLTLNDLTLSEGSCFGGRRCSAAPHPWGGGEGGGAGRWPPGLQFQLVWVKGGREKSCENCLGHLCWPPSSKNRSQACSRSRGSNWEHEMHCFFSFFFPTDLKEILLWTDQACLLFENSP